MTLFLSHLPTPSTYHSLISLVTSTRTNENIQSELVEILGFQGQGLQLVEELLRPGARAFFLEDREGNGGSTPIIANGKVRLHPSLVNYS